MPPRKRRARLTSVRAPSPPPASASTSRATSEHSSPKSEPKPPPPSQHLPASSPAPESLIATYKKNCLAHPTAFSLPTLALHLYQHFIDWVIAEVAITFKHNVYLASETKRHRLLLENTTPSRDIPKHNPRLLFSEKNVNVECSICSSNFSASRYAQHVEKCMGRGGRMSSRAASARLRASAERERERDANDNDDVPVKRRRHADHEGGYSGVYSKRRKMSPVPGSGGSHRSAALPPSGRTRSSPP